MADQEFLRVVASDLNHLCENQDWDLTLTEFLESPCLILNGTAFNRREVLTYVANKLGGNHFDKRGDQRFALLDHGQSVIDAVYHELLSIARLVTSSEEIELLRSRLNSLSS